MDSVQHVRIIKSNVAQQISNQYVEVDEEVHNDLQWRNQTLVMVGPRWGTPLSQTPPMQLKIHNTSPPHSGLFIHLYVKCMVMCLASFIHFIEY